MFSVIILISILCYTSNGFIVTTLPEDTWLTFGQIATRYGMPNEEFDIISEGYILKMHHIIGDRTKPVLIVHGLVDASDNYIIRGNISIIAAMARDNYDIWAINLRGSRYSRRHVTLNPDTDREFWDYSFHEFGYYDIPATIDFVLAKTRQKKLSVIALSLGTTSMLVMGATRPEYNDKVKVFIALAPICYTHNIETFVNNIAKLSPIFNDVLKATRKDEVAGFHSPEKDLINLFCVYKYKETYDLCVTNGIFILAGAHPKEIELEFVPVIFGHFPTGTSRKNLNHLGQININERFAYYDYGVDNLKKYKRLKPPKYDLKKVTMRVGLIVGKNDKVSTIADVALLRQRLPNVVSYSVVPDDAFTHADYTWGRNAYKTMFPLVFDLLNKYS